MRRVSYASSLRIGGVLAVPIALGAVLCVVLLVGARDRATLHTDRDVRATVAQNVTQIRTELRNELSAASAGSEPTDTIVRPADVARARMDPDRAIEARDAGAATLDDSVGSGIIIVPLYRDGTTPTSTAQRRTDLVGYRLSALHLGQALAELSADSGGLSVHGPNRPVLAVPAAAPSGSITYSVDMDLQDAPGWGVDAWLPTPGVPGEAWFWVVGIVLVAGLGAGGLGVLLRREGQAQARRQQLERDRSLINGLAPVLQASLDLGEVVPAVAAHLSEGMNLTGLSLTAPTERGERQLFASGVTPNPAVLPTIRPTNGLAPGDTFALSLTRGGRVLGVLRVVAGTHLRRDDLIALATAGELLGSTLANAEAYARQQDLVERMRSVDELKTVFIATASHELRTPVTAIVGFSALLEQYGETLSAEKSHDLVTRIHANSKRLEALTEQLLDFARLEGGLPSTDDHILDLGETVAQILADQPEFAARHRVDTHLSPRCMTRGTPAAMERIVTNLVGNAAKYAPAGTTISITVQAEGSRVVLLVDDEGPGVPEIDRDRVFSRFYRGRGESVVRTRGAGVGLAIVAEYAASMSGSATVLAAPSGGARFRVSFPAVAAYAAGAPVQEPFATITGGVDVALS